VVTDKGALIPTRITDLGDGTYEIRDVAIFNINKGESREAAVLIYWHLYSKQIEKSDANSDHWSTVPPELRLGFYAFIVSIHGPPNFILRL
jgi:hypothetical protein